MKNSEFEASDKKYKLREHVVYIKRVNGVVNFIPSSSLGPLLPPSWNHLVQRTAFQVVLLCFDAVSVKKRFGFSCNLTLILQCALGILTLQFGIETPS